MALAQCPYFQEATDASLRADYFLRSALSGLKTISDERTKKALSPGLARLIHNRDHIHREMIYSYQGPEPHLLASGLQHVLLQHQHLSMRVHQVSMKLQHLACDACQLHVKMLEVALTHCIKTKFKVHREALTTSTAQKKRKRPAITQARQTRRKRTKSCRSN